MDIRPTVNFGLELVPNCWLKNLGFALLVCGVAACSPARQTPMVTEASRSYFQHYVIDDDPPGGPECCTDVIASGDINGDGFHDLVLGSENAEGAGLVWYEYPTWRRRDIAVGQFTTDGTVFDFDQDGDNDIVIGDLSRGLVWIEQTDRQSEWLVHTLAEGQYVHDLEIADIDSDGKLDIAVTDKAGLYIYWGANVPDSEKTTLLERPGEGLQIVDLDADGDQDLLFSNLWIEQTENRSWNVREIDPVWTVDTRTVAADMNGDGRLDIVMSGSEGESPLAWFEATSDLNADGWLRHVIEDDMLVGAHSLLVADLDGDSALDVVAAEMHTSPSKRVLVYLSRDGGWEKIVIGGHGSHNMIVADFDRDGDLDLMGKNYAGLGRFVEYWENRMADLRLRPRADMDAGSNKSDWIYDAVTQERPESDRYKFGLLVADVDLNGLTDVVSGGSIYRNPGGSDRTEWERLGIDGLADVIYVTNFVVNGWRQIIAVDDKSIELFSASSSDGRNWTVSRLHDLPLGRTQGSAVTTMNSSGEYELYFSRGKTLQRLTLNGSLPPDQWVLTEVRDDVEEADVAVGDLDRDGLSDVVAVDQTGRRLLLMEREGNEFVTHYVGASLFWIDRVGLADIDLDGDLDIVYTEENRDGEFNAHVYWLKAPADTWSGTWERQPIAVLRSINSLSLADIDANGYADIVIAEHTDLRPGDEVLDNFTGIFLNRGGGNWEPRVVEIGVHSSHVGAKIADLDGDGDLDIVSQGWEQSCCIHGWLNPNNRHD